MPSTNRSIVMVDWARRNGPTSPTRDQFLWHQMLLSLLYDDIFAQDETLVCSKKMAGWFPDSESFRLLEETIECGGLRVLKRPWQRYPQELQEFAQQQPISARREFLAKFSVNNDASRLTFDDKQRAFHGRLEAFLLDRPGAHRDAGSQNKLGEDLMQAFATLLAAVLTDQRYKKWLGSRFRNITPETADDFVRFTRDPSVAIERLKKKRPDQPARFTPQSGKQEFSTALAVEVADTYAKKEAKELQELIETVFARPFCQDEDADGRYGQLLQDLPVLLEVEKGETGKVDVVKVETEVKVLLILPWPGPNFSKIIQTVRGETSGINLRTAMNQIGGDLTFEKANSAWQAVADDIASRAGRTKMKKIDLRMLMVSVGQKAVWGALVTHSLRGAAVGALAGVYGSVGGDLYSNLRADYERQQFSRQIKESVKWACVRHPTIPGGQELREG